MFRRVKANPGHPHERHDGHLQLLRPGKWLLVKIGLTRSISCRKRGITIIMSFMIRRELGLSRKGYSTFTQSSRVSYPQGYFWSFGIEIDREHGKQLL